MERYRVNSTLLKVIRFRENIREYSLGNRLRFLEYSLMKKEDRRREGYEVRVFKWV